MALRFHLPLTCLLALAPLAAIAQQPAAPQPLPAWEQLTQEQRELLLAPVRERWNSSPPERRQHMLEHARRWQSMSPQQRREARHGQRRWENMPPQKREQARALFERVRSLPEDERKQVIERWRAMSPEQRKAWLESAPPSADTGPAKPHN